MTAQQVNVEFYGCVDREICDSALFRVLEPVNQTVEVRITEQSESILARELGRDALDAPARESILTIAGGWLIQECLETHGHIDKVLLLTSDFLFRRHGLERTLLREAGLLT